MIGMCLYLPYLYFIVKVQPVVLTRVTGLTGGDM